MSAVRGFTTLQLLELAAIAEANRLRATGQIPISEGTGQPEDLNRSRTVITQLEAFLSQGGHPLAFPAKARGLKLRKYLTGGADEQSWFNNGQLQPPFAARSAEGAYIESQRGRIYDYLAAGALAYVSNQTHYGLDYSFGKQGVPFAGSALDDIITSSWRLASGAAKSGRRAAVSPQQAFQARIAKVQAVWALTQRNQEPAAVERAGGVGRIGQRQPASPEDVNSRVAESNGFVSKNLAKALKVVGQSPQQLYQNFAAQAGNNPEGFREALWGSLGQGSLNTLLRGLGIRTPEDPATGKRSFRYNAALRRGAQGQYDEAFSRFVFDALFDAYLQRGAGGDRLPADAQARSNKRLENAALGIGSGARGVLGTNDKALQGLSLQAPAQVAKFIRKALQRQYTLEALKQGARAIGAPVNESSVLQDAVIQSAADHIIVSYNQQVQAGSAAHTSAVAEAARLRGYNSLKTAAAVDEARRAILRTLDAQNGFMTEPCQVDAKGHVTNYSKRDLKRIAKANGVALAAAATGAAACAAIGAVVARAPASADALSSGRRQPQAIAAPAAVSGRRTSGQRSGRRAAAPAGALAGMAAPGALSPNTQAAFAMFNPQQPAAGGLLVSPRAGQALSGGSSGRRSGGNSPRAVFAAAPASPRLGSANNLMNLFGEQK